MSWMSWPHEARIQRHLPSHGDDGPEVVHGRIRGRERRPRAVGDLPELARRWRIRPAVPAKLRLVGAGWRYRFSRRTFLMAQYARVDNHAGRGFVSPRSHPPQLPFPAPAPGLLVASAVSRSAASFVTPNRTHITGLSTDESGTGSFVAFSAKRMTPQITGGGNSSHAANCVGSCTVPQPATKAGLLRRSRDCGDGRRITPRATTEPRGRPRRAIRSTLRRAGEVQRAPWTRTPRGTCAGPWRRIAVAAPKP